MHRKMWVCAALCAALFMAAACPAWADLAGLETKVINGSPVVYDNATGYYWRPDLPSFANQTYTQQKDKIARESYAGLSGWHMADYAEITTIWQYNIDALIQNFNRTLHEYYGDGSAGDRYSGRYDNGLAIIIDYYEHNDSKWFQSWPADHIDRSVGAWAVTTSAVPLPSSLLLLSLGTLLMGGAGKLRRRMRRN